MISLGVTQRADAPTDARLATGRWATTRRGLIAWFLAGHACLVVPKPVRATSFSPVFRGVANVILRFWVGGDKELVSLVSGDEVRQKLGQLLSDDLKNAGADVSVHTQVPPELPENWATTALAVYVNLILRTPDLAEAPNDILVGAIGIVLRKSTLDRRTGETVVDVVDLRPEPFLTLPQGSAINDHAIYVASEQLRRDVVPILAALNSAQ